MKFSIIRAAVLLVAPTTVFASNVPESAEFPELSVAEAVTTPLSRCDVEPNGHIDKLDLAAMKRRRNQQVNGPDDPADADADGRITFEDFKICTRKCTLPGCATPE